MTTTPENPNRDEEEKNHVDDTQGVDDFLTVEKIVSKYTIDEKSDTYHHYDHDEDEIIDADDTNVSADDNDDSEKENNSSTENTAKSYSPLSDDEEWLASDDVILGEEDDSAIIKQEDGMVEWKIKGLYNDSGKTHNYLYLNENPPIMIVEGSDGEYASFIMTKKFTKTMNTALTDLHKAYHGVGRKRGEARTITDKISSVPSWASENKSKAFILSILVAAFIVLLITTGISN